MPRVSAIALLLAWCAASTAAADVELIDFAIVDQFEVEHTDEQYQDGIFVVVGADRKGSAYSGEWSAAIRAAIESLASCRPLRIAGLAHMRKVPGFLRGVVRSRFPQEPGEWVLLDWQGVFEEAYGNEKKNVTILVFLDSTLVHRTHGREVDPAEVDELRTALAEALESPASLARCAWLWWSRPFRSR